MGICFDKRVLIGLGVAALAVFAFSPKLLGAVGPFLLLAACPLSMVFMMRAMNRSKSDDAESAASSAAGDARSRELEEEVNRLRAEARLRDEQWLS